MVETKELNVKEMSDKQLFIAKNYYLGARHKANDLVQVSDGYAKVKDSFAWFNFICQGERIVFKERMRRLREEPWE